MPDLASDYPKLPTYLSKTLMTLHELDAIEWKDIQWFDPKVPEDQQVTVEQYYHLMARVLNLIYLSSGSKE